MSCKGALVLSHWAISPMLLWGLLLKVLPRCYRMSVTAISPRKVGCGFYIRVPTFAREVDMHWNMDSPEQTFGWRSTCELVLSHLSSAPRLVVVHWTLDPNTYGQVWRRGDFEPTSSRQYRRQVVSTWCDLVPHRRRQPVESTTCAAGTQSDGHEFDRRAECGG